MNFALEDSRRLAETICEPQPIRCPRVLTGGDGEKKTLRLVAQYADIWNSTVTDADQLIHKIEVLNRHCDALSSPPAERYDATGTPTTLAGLGTIIGVRPVPSRQCECEEHHLLRAGIKLVDVRGSDQRAFESEF